MSVEGVQTEPSIKPYGDSDNCEICYRGTHKEWPKDNEEEYEELVHNEYAM